MNKRFFALSFIAIFAAAFTFIGCKKLNESTDLGGGLIPPIDNINTFDTSITVLAYNDTLGLLRDSTRLGSTDEFFVGKINNDPFFGKTDARMFVEFKPPAYPFVFNNIPSPDSLFIDSVVLVLDYVETYGDTITPQTINVYEIDQSSDFRPDSAYLIRQNNFLKTTLLGSKLVTPERLKDSVKTFDGDTLTHQLRLKLNNSFGTRLLMYDSTQHPARGAYANDSTFRSKFKGFAIESASTGNAVMGFDVTGSKLAIYYKYEKRTVQNVSQIDTATAYFTFKSGLGTGNALLANSAVAGYVIRDYTGTAAQASLNNGAGPDPIIYLQNTPGTYASLKIPDLALISNRVIHRAELVMEQIYDINDSIFRTPDFLYLDAVDPTITANPKLYRTIPYDLGLNTSGTLDYQSFGVVPVVTTDPFGNKVKTWKLNLTRYVQHVLTHTQSLYEFRLFPAFRFAEQYGLPPGADTPIPIFVNSSAVKGRVRLYGNNGTADVNPRRMRLRLIYSKL